MPFQKPDIHYWENKFAAYLHDPFDKAFRIQRHEERASSLLEAYGLRKPMEEVWKRADGIAASLERGELPSYSPDSSKDGSINFITMPVLTHPTGAEPPLDISLPVGLSVEKVHAALLDHLKSSVGDKPGEGYSSRFTGNPDAFARARIFHAHFALRFELAEKNVAGIGSLWHRLPADTRFPDHSIWHHNAMTSALYSCAETGRGESDIAMMAVSIAPVQDFISQARKLRDYWSASVLLSWLAFEGIRWIMENLGPDHLLYPSLVDQPLVNGYLKTVWNLDVNTALKTPEDIASLPNKFLFLAPMSLAKEIGDAVSRTIRTAWSELGAGTADLLSRHLPPDQANAVKERFGQPYWDVSWSASKLADGSEAEEISRLLPSKRTGEAFGMLAQMRKLRPGRHGFGSLYGLSHEICQSALAAVKTSIREPRKPQNGEKCGLCGEFEILHPLARPEKLSAEEYRNGTRGFWEALASAMEGDLKEGERFCPVCAVKRFAYRVVRPIPEHPLHSVLSRSGFPSTAEIAFSDYFIRESVPPAQRRDLAERMLDSPDEQSGGPAETDRYYAILMMDGDRMGKLLRGDSLSATWKSILHPEIVRRLKDPSFDGKYRDVWEKIFVNDSARLSPSVHASISEALADFSLYAVPAVSDRFRSRLIYAGGDDVCAVLPFREALQAARELSVCYSAGFVELTPETRRTVSGQWTPGKGKLSVNLGKGKEISISAGILICHYKENLGEMIRIAHGLLTIAKEQAGRNACALRLRKRSGGDRTITAKWDDPVWQSFDRIIRDFSGDDGRRLSRSLVYRIQQMEPAFLAIGNNPAEAKRFLAALVAHSGESGGLDIGGLSSAIRQLVLRNGRFEPESLIIASFLAGAEDERSCNKIVK